VHQGRERMNPVTRSSPGCRGRTERGGLVSAITPALAAA
jgi:hypothetical protein